MKKFFLYSILFICSQSAMTAQKNVKRWFIVADTEEKTVFIDTTSIKETDGQLSLWSLVRFKKPKDFIMYKSKVSKVKSHLLFNTREYRFTVIGALYFDKRSRIVGESSTPIISQSIEKVSSPIKANSDEQIMLEKANEYISNGKIFYSNGDKLINDKSSKYVIQKYFEHENTIQDTTVNPFENVNNRTELLNDSALINKTVGKELRDELMNSNIDSLLTRKKSDNISPDKKLADSLGNNIGMQLKSDLESINDSIVNDYAANSSASQDSIAENNKIIDGENMKIDTTLHDESNVKNGLKNESNKKVDIKVKKFASYNSDNDKQVSKYVWSDGKLFVIQLSSWRSKLKAESLLSKLVTNGYTAFVFSKYIPEKKRKFYRVRVGYFNSLSEAESFLKSIK